MAETAPWRLGADGRWVAEVGALGSLVVWTEPSGYRWSMAALGTERGGYLSAVAAKTAAVREARQQLVAGLCALVELDAARFGEDRGERSAPGLRFSRIAIREGSCFNCGSNLAPACVASTGRRR